MFWVGVISYVSHNCPNELRTLKHGIINAIYTISTLIGIRLAGFLNVGLGFYGAFLVSILINLAAITFGLLYVKDTSEPYDKNVEWLVPKSFIQSYLNVFKGRTKSFTITLAGVLLCHGVLVGRIGGTLFSVTVLSHCMKINDAVIGCIACTFDMLAAVCYVFAAEPWQLYCIPLIDIFQGTALTISTSLTSKLVHTDELGRINSIQGIISTFLSILILLLYSTTYYFTFEFLAGAFYLLNIILTFPLLIMFAIIYRKCKHLWT